MSIEYKTEGRLLIACEQGNCKSAALTWVKGDTVVRIHNGSNTIELSKSQLRQISEFATEICSDLAPRSDE